MRYPLYFLRLATTPYLFSHGGLRPSLARRFKLSRPILNLKHYIRQDPNSVCLKLDTFEKKRAVKPKQSDAAHQTGPQPIVSPVLVDCEIGLERLSSYEQRPWISSLVSACRSWQAWRPLLVSGQHCVGKTRNVPAPNTRKILIFVGI